MISPDKGVPTLLGANLFKKHLNSVKIQSADVGLPLVYMLSHVLARCRFNLDHRARIRAKALGKALEEKKTTRLNGMAAS